MENATIKINLWIHRIHAFYADWTFFRHFREGKQRRFQKINNIGNGFKVFFKLIKNIVLIKNHKTKSYCFPENKCLKSSIIKSFISS